VNVQRIMESIATVLGAAALALIGVFALFHLLRSWSANAYGWGACAVFTVAAIE
jgi:hypothetical protein